MDVRIEGQRLYLVSYTERELDWFKRKLSFEKQWGKTIDVAELYFVDQKGYYTFTGLLEPLRNSTKMHQINVINPPQFEFQNHDVKNDLLEGVSLFDFQVGAIKKALIVKKGIIQLPTGGGKSEVLLALLRFLLDRGIIENALVLVPSVVLAEQLFNRAIKRGFSSEEIGVVHGFRKDYGCNITIAVSNSIHKGIEKDDPKVTAILEKCDFFAADEFHHGRSDTWMKILTACANAKYIIGFTATPFHNDDVLKDAGDALVQGITGGPLFKISHSYLRNLVLPDGTVGLTALPIIHFVKLPGKMAVRNYGWHKIYNQHVVDDKIRNEKIVKFIQLFKRFRFPVLILLQRKEHAEKLMLMLNDRSAICVFGNQKGMQFDEYGMIQDVGIDYTQFTKDFEAGVYDVCFASQVFDEGFDCLDEQTEILTESGWAGIGEVNEGDQVYTVNLAEKCLQLCEVEKYIERQVKSDEEMVTLKSQHLDIRVTDNHNFVFSKDRNTDDNLYLGKHGELPNRFILHFNSRSLFNQEGISLSNEALWLLGVLWTDGCVERSSKRSISQTKPEIVSKLRSNLNTLGLDYTFRVRDTVTGYGSDKPAYEFYIPKGTHSGFYSRSGWFDIYGDLFNKEPKPELLEMNREQFLSFCSGLLDGNGDNQSTGNKIPRLCLSRKDQVDFLMHLAVRLGFKVMYGSYETDNKVTMYNLCLSDKIEHKMYLKDARGAKKECKAPSQNERVWCVSTKNQTLVTRRNGKVLVLGNCPSIGAVINAGAGRSRIKINQRTGRGLRAKKGQPNQVYIIDFVDRGHVFLNAQYKARKKMYEDMEALIEFDENKFWLMLKDHHDQLHGC